MLELECIRKKRGSHEVLKDITLSVETGEFFAVLGPSGCGKTTLLKIIAGLDYFDKGTMKFAGQSMAQVPPHRRPFHMVFQRYALFPHLNVAGNVGFGLRFQNLTALERQRRIGAALDLVRLSGFETRGVDTLSGGQAQRVALARSLVLEPKVLLLDEPMAALDPKIRQSMQAELKDLQRRLGVTFVMVTHDQDEALFLADRIAVMHQGQIEQVGRKEDVYLRPKSRFVAHFIGETNEISVRISRVMPEGVEVAVGNHEQSRLVATLPDSLSSLPKVGERVSLFIRPEHISLFETAEKDVSNLLPVSLIDSSFRGPMNRFELKTFGEDPFSLVVYGLGKSAHDSKIYQPGKKFFASFAPNHGTVLGG